jgi:hypothetical protein
MEAEKYVMEIWKKKRNEEIGKKIYKAMIEIAMWIFENKDRFGIEDPFQIADVIKEALDYVINKIEREGI